MPAERLEANLQLLGLPETVRKGLDAKTTTSNLLPLVAPADGVVVSRDVVAGEVVDPARILFEVVDPTSLWLTVDLKAEDARRVRAGLPVRFQPDAGGPELSATVAWISPQADPKTRTANTPGDVQHDPTYPILPSANFTSVMDWSSTSAPTGESFEAIELASSTSPPK